ncbi:TadE/TadG family type IV pilus assembly protein [Erythrobacter sp. HKB08]|uniref:TadE/TadG family type IV pilus assembly protein n=1 Tax=Erythrobacter sp. HKB08 TaxID=2502843 RepID=UPI0013E8AADB|nr:TadE/TadG family type IV pilus assembly protein [Erythrobacter sp. HKB08]
MKHFLSTLARDRAAVAMTEFALATPLMLTAILGGVEMTHYISTTMRVEQVAASVADNIGRVGDQTELQDRKLYENQINDILMGSEYTATEEINFLKRGRIIVSSLEIFSTLTHCRGGACNSGGKASLTDGDQFIAWQRCLGEKNATSSYGTLYSLQPDGMGPSDARVYAEPSGSTIFVEVTYDYEPIFTDTIIPTTEIRAVSSFIVRHQRDRSEIYKRNDFGTSTEARCDVYTDTIS